MNIDEFLSHFPDAKKTSTGWIAMCPAHEGERRALSIALVDDKILVDCKAGCKTEAVLAAKGLKMSDLFVSNGDRPKREIVATYDYTDERGEVLYQVVRFAPKDFRQRRPDGAGGWVWNLQGTRHVLYHLPKVVAAAQAGFVVYICEGEKDVDSLEKTGAIATCNAGGAGKWRDDYSEALRGAQVVIVADKDEPGRKHAAQVAASLQGKAASVRIVEAKQGKDAADHLAAGYGLDDLVGVNPTAADPTGQSGDDATHTDPFFLDWPAFWSRERSEAEWVYPDVLARGRGHALYAPHKDGKSLLMLYIAARLAAGKERFAVVYLDYEQTLEDVQDRLEDMGYGASSDLSRLHYALLPALPPLDTAEGAEALMKRLDQAQSASPDCHLVAIIDTIGRAVAGEEDSADTFRDFYNHSGIELKRRGVTWARLDHAGKDPGRGQRGSSGKGDDVDIVWRLMKTQSGAALKRELSRMPWVPEKVTFGLFEDPLRFARLARDWPSGTEETAALLDRLDVPVNASVRTAQNALKSIDEGRRGLLIQAALRWRRERESEP